MSDLIVLKNISPSATVGIHPDQQPLDRNRFPQQECMAGGVEVYIGPEGEFLDKNGVVMGCFKGDAESYFVNCTDVDQAKALRIQEKNYGWLHPTEPLRRGYQPKDEQGNPLPGWKFMGWFGILSVVRDDSKAHAERMKTAAAGPSENFRAIQRLEAKVAELTNEVGRLGKKNAELESEAEALRAEVRVLKGPGDPKKK